MVNIARKFKPLAKKKKKKTIIFIIIWAGSESVAPTYEVGLATHLVPKGIGATWPFFDSKFLIFTANSEWSRGI